jgi:hypothetical protein
MKGILESIEQFLMVAAALALVAVMISLVFNLWPGPEQTGVAGKKDEVSRILAEKSWECFKKHRFGADPKSGVCFTLELTSDELITESDVTRFLNCEELPNNDCHGCENCVSGRMTEQDKLTYKVEKANTFFKISYSGSDRKVEISGFGCFSDAECSDGNSCTSDVCSFPKTLKSRCVNTLNCSLCEEGMGAEGSDWCRSCKLKSEYGFCDDGIDNDCDLALDTEDSDC